MSKFSITREIGIDAGHRIPNHSSKCKSIHGHRYIIYATVEGELAKEGSEEGMAGGMDFSFLKDLMIDNIDYFCDHALILYLDDPLVDLFHPMIKSSGVEIKASGVNWSFTTDSTCGKLYLIDVIPTAENLAKHWYDRLYNDIFVITNGKAVLTKIRVDETPNCYAQYPS
jgi:6-pyruvoyltetrahydropterin/6-carboxytetrahydropterin synthase